MIPIPPSEYLAWKGATGHIVYPSEYAILRAMDGAFRAETAKELSDYRARQNEAAAIEAKNNGRNGGKRK